MKVLLIAEDSAGIQVLDALQQRDHEIVAVMAKRVGATRRGASVWSVAKRAGLPTWSAERVMDPALGDEIRDLNVDLLLNVYSLFVINDRVLEAASVGSYNLHPGPLPAYAGLNSVSWAIYRGERLHGVTIHRMAPVVDSGPIAYQETFPIEKTDTGLTLSTRCIKAGVKLMTKLVDVAAQDPAQIPAIEQDLSMRSFFGAGTPNDGRLLWTLSAKSVSDFVRACDYHPLSSPWGYPIATIAGRELGVVRVSLTGAPADSPPGAVRSGGDHSVLVACIDEWVRVEAVVERGRHLPASDALVAVGPGGGP